MPAAALELWQDGLRRTFDDYLTVADRVIVLRDTPWSPVDVPSCLSDSPDRPDDCAFDLAGAAHRDAELHAAELDIAPDGVDFLDLTAEICPDDPCQVVTETGVIKYRDQHHLTRTFALDLVPRIERRLSPLVERGP